MRSAGGWHGAGCLTLKCPAQIHALMFRTEEEAAYVWNTRRNGGVAAANAPAEALQERCDFLLAACRDAQRLASRYGWALNKIARGDCNAEQVAHGALLGTDAADQHARFEAAMRVNHPEWSFTPDPVFDYHNERTRCAWEGWQAAGAASLPAPYAPASDPFIAWLLLVNGEPADVTIERNEAGAWKANGGDVRGLIEAAHGWPDGGKQK